MIDKNITQLVKDFLKENSVDELQDYLTEKGYSFESKEEWETMLRPIIKETGVPENQVEKIIEGSFEN